MRKKRNGFSSTGRFSETLRKKDRGGCSGGRQIWSLISETSISVNRYWGGTAKSAGEGGEKPRSMGVKSEVLGSREGYYSSQKKNGD